ncbi:MAG: hypothetical protein ACO1NU_03480 [Arcticibacter sp.]
MSNDRHSNWNSILIYRTSVQNTNEKSRVADKLNYLVGEKNWTIDLDDEDKVLRVVCNKEVARDIEQVFAQYAYTCESMPYW